MAVSAYALTSLSALKTYLNVSTTTDDTLMEALVDRASDKVETYCGRKFITRAYREWRDGYGKPQIVLRQRPVTAVRRVAYGSQPAMTIVASVAADIRNTVEVQDDQIVTNRVDSAGAETTGTYTFAANLTTGAMATAINLVTGFTASATASIFTKDLHRRAGVDVKNNAVTLTYPDQSASIIHVDEDRGVLHMRWSSLSGFEDEDTGGFPCGRQNVLCEYTAGYADVASLPAGLQQATIQLAAGMYAARGRDLAIRSESLGDYAYTIANAVELGDSMRELLGDYREIR